MHGVDNLTMFNVFLFFILLVYLKRFIYNGFNEAEVFFFKRTCNEYEKKIVNIIEYGGQLLFSVGIDLKI